MSFIVLEKFGGNVNVCTNEDGETLEFETAELAQVEADDCQDGQVVEV
jgi:hypothetical protein